MLICKATWKCFPCFLILQLLHIPHLIAGDLISLHLVCVSSKNTDTNGRGQGDGVRGCIFPLLKLGH